MDEITRSVQDVVIDTLRDMTHRSVIMTGTLADNGITSITDLVEFCGRVEEECRVALPDDEIMPETDLERIVALLEAVDANPRPATRSARIQVSTRGLHCRAFKKSVKR